VGEAENKCQAGKVVYTGRGGGGAIGAELSDENMEVIDFGIRILSVHTPYSIGSKVDIYWLYRALRAFYLK